MHKLHLVQPGFPFSPYGASRKFFGETFNLKHLYRDALDKVCFAYDAAYCESKVYAKRVISDKILKYITY